MPVRCAWSAGAPLRLWLRLVYVTTIAGILGYLFLLGYYAWYVIGWEKYYSTPELRIPRSTEAITVLALLTAGVFAGQVVRQARRMVERYPVTLVPSPGNPAFGSEVLDSEARTRRAQARRGQG